MKIQIKKLIVLCFVVFLIFIIPQCLAKVSDLTLEADPFQYENDVFKEWSNNMKKIGITTEERGLIFRVTVSNIQNEPITVEKLMITVRGERTDSGSNSFFEQVSDYIYLPPNEKTEVDIPVEFGYGDVIGSYSAEIQYSGEGLYGTQNIEPYPFEFRVLSEDQFQKELEQKQDSPFISIGDINITLFEFSAGFSIFSIGLAITLYIIYRKRR